MRYSSAEYLLFACMFGASIVLMKYQGVMHHGGQRAIQYMRRTENDITPEFMDDIIEKAFERFKCRQRISDDCKSCLNGRRLFRMVGATSRTLNADGFERASQLILCYARDMETMCQDHDDSDDYQSCNRNMLSQWSGLSGANSMVSAAGIREYLEELRESYSERVENVKDAIEDAIEDANEQKEKDDDQDDNHDHDDDHEDDDDDDVDNEVKRIEASLFSSNCLSADRIFDELDIDDEDETNAESVGGLSALILFHLVNGDQIRASCRTLPRVSTFTDDLFDNTDEFEIDEFRDVLDELRIGLGPTAQASFRSPSYNSFAVSAKNQFTPRRAKRSSLPREKRAVKVEKIDPQRCFSQDELLVIFKADKLKGVPKSTFKDVCPVLIQQQLSTACHGVIKSGSSVEVSKKYIFVTVAGLIICICSFVGITIIPCLSRSIYQTILVFYMGLAFGTLIAHALMQLIPKTFGIQFSLDSRSYVGLAPSWFSLVMCAAIYILYLLECIIEKARNGSSTSENNNDVISNTDLWSANQKRGQFKMSDVTDGFKQLYSKGVSPTVVIVAVTDCIHNLAAGLAIGVSFSYSYDLGLGTAIGVTVHHIIHELGQAAILLNAGLSIVQVIGLRVCISLVAMLGVYVGAITSDVYVQKWVFAINAAMFLYIALAKIAPTILSAIQQTNFGLKFVVHNIGIVGGVAIIAGLSMIDENMYHG